MFIISILYCIYIFRTSLSRILLYFLSLKRYLFKHQRVLFSIKIYILQVLTTNYLHLSSIKYKLSTILIKKNRWDNYDRLINRLSYFKAIRFRGLHLIQFFSPTLKQVQRVLKRFFPF